MLPLMFFLVTTNEKTTVLPLMFFFVATNKKRQCYPLCFFSWRTKKNNSVTPFFLFDEYRQSNRRHQPDLNPGLQGVRQRALHCTTEAKTIHYNPSSIKRIYMTLKCMCVFLLFPLFFFSWRPKNMTVLPFMVFFMTTKEKQRCHALCFIW